MEIYKLKEDEIVVNNIIMRKYNYSWWGNIRRYNKKMYTINELIYFYNKIFRTPYCSKDINWQWFSDDLAKDVDEQYAEAGFNLEYVYLDRIVYAFNNEYTTTIGIYIDQITDSDTETIKDISYAEWLKLRWTKSNEKPCWVKWQPDCDVSRGCWVETEKIEPYESVIFQVHPDYWQATKQGLSMTPTKEEEYRFIANCMKNCDCCSKFNTCRHRFLFPQSPNIRFKEYDAEIEKIYNFSCSKYEYQPADGSDMPQFDDEFEF